MSGVYVYLLNCCSPDGQTLASAAADETLRFWRVWAPRELETLTAATQSAKQSNQRSVLAKQPGKRMSMNKIR
jgi:WD40 repeat protein